MVDIEEVKHRLKEKIKDRYPDAKIEDKGKELVIKKGEAKMVFYPQKLRDEMNESNPAEWDDMVEKRIRILPWEEEERVVKWKINDLVPRIYSKSNFMKDENEMTREELEKAGIIILKELKDEWIILAADTDEAFISLPEKEILKQMSKREFKAKKERAKRFLDEIL